jgi:DNA mismatch repair protein MSH2
LLLTLVLLQRLAKIYRITVDLEAVANHEYLIKADFDESLQEIKANIDHLISQVYPIQVEVSEDLNLEIEKKLKCEKNSHHGYFLRISRSDAGLINSKKYIELGTQKAGY